MHDLSFIRNNPKLFDTMMHRRRLASVSNSILTKDSQERERLLKIQNLRKRKNDIASEIAQMKKTNQDTSLLENESKKIDPELQLLENDTENYLELQSILMSIPNVLDDETPIGKDASDNVVIKTYGQKPEFDFDPLPHWDLGEKLGVIDSVNTAKISGSRFVTLIDQIAKMERALEDMMLTNHCTKYNYTEMSPPYMVYDKAMYGAGQLPKFSEESFALEGKFRLIPTAEVPLLNLFSDRIINEKELPIRLTASTACFRSEAGSSGRDTRGILRLHQFRKVELISIASPEKGRDELAVILHAAEEILQKLQIHYRIIDLCEGDLGFTSSRTYDIEVWMPGQNRYVEISSCSNCRDFQSRRMNTRYKNKDGQSVFPYTLNGSGLAIGRTIAAIMENYQQKDGSILIPKILHGYFDDKKITSKNKIL